jgi:hypothetical protein
MSPGYTAPGPFRQRTLRSLSSCLGLLATHSLDPTRTSGDVRLRAAVEGISDIKGTRSATFHFMKTSGPSGLAKPRGPGALPPTIQRIAGS